jgi:beta-ureidopropionase
MKLLVAALQNSVYKGGYEKNLTLISLKTESLVFHHSPYLIVYSELMNVPTQPTSHKASYFNYAETMYGETVKRTLELAVTHDIHIIGTFLEKIHENGKVNYYNTAFLCSPTQGIIGKYRKIYFTENIGSLGNTHKKEHVENCQAEKEISVFSLDNGIKIGILIGLDSTLSVAWHTLADQGAQLIIVPTAAYGELQSLYLEDIITRAVKHNVFVIVVNKAGNETVEDYVISYFGNSCIITPTGKVLTKLNNDEWAELIGSIDLSILQKNKETVKISNKIKKAMK